MNSRIKRRNNTWITLDGDHAEFETASYTTSIAKEAMSENKKTRGNFTTKTTKTRRSKLPTLTKEEAKARRQNMKETKAKRLETIVHKPYIEKPKTNKELQLFMNTLYRIKCVLQNCTIDAPTVENNRKINIFLNCKKQPAGTVENAHISKYLKQYNEENKVLAKVSNTLRVLFPTLLHHIAVTNNNDKVETIYSSPNIPANKIQYFSQDTLDLYNSIQLFKEQMFK